MQILKEITISSVTFLKREPKSLKMGLGGLIEGVKEVVPGVPGVDTLKAQKKTEKEIRGE